MLIDSQPGAAGAQIASREDRGIGVQQCRRRGRAIVVLVAVGRDHQRVIVKRFKIQRQRAHTYALQKAQRLRKHRRQQRIVVDYRLC
jgi:hypothetical protein